MSADGRDGAARLDDEPTQKLPPGFARESLFEHFAEHCAQWPDQPHPAFSGETPQKVAATTIGRLLVEALIFEMEQQARGTPVAEACDFERLRLELGLSPQSGVRKRSDLDRFLR